mmetsp:Transcript_36765/g.118637  ORF Transcript_36765/g.118637 Transcript_36765/m.118637 type:complete len:260 (-) Transcript_36765:89-868(-)
MILTLTLARAALLALLLALFALLRERPLRRLHQRVRRGARRLEGAHLRRHKLLRRPPPPPARLADRRSTLSLRPAAGVPRRRRAHGAEEGVDDEHSEGRLLLHRGRVEQRRPLHLPPLPLPAAVSAALRQQLGKIIGGQQHQLHDCQQRVWQRLRLGHAHLAAVRLEQPAARRRLRLPRGADLPPRLRSDPVARRGRRAEEETERQPDRSGQRRVARRGDEPVAEQQLRVVERLRGGSRACHGRVLAPEQPLRVSSRAS